MGIHSLLRHVGIDVPDVIHINGREVREMAEELNRDGVAYPTLGRIVLYIPEVPQDGAPIYWPSIVTETVSQSEMNIRLTAFPPGQPPRGIEAVVTYGEPLHPEPNTWIWPPRV